MKPGNNFLEAKPNLLPASGGVCYLYIFLYIFLSVYLSFFLYILLSVYLYICIYILRSIYPNDKTQSAISTRTSVKCFYSIVE